MPEVFQMIDRGKKQSRETRGPAAPTTNIRPYNVPITQDSKRNIYMNVFICKYIYINEYYPHNKSPMPFVMTHFSYHKFLFHVSTSFQFFHDNSHLRTRFGHVHIFMENVTTQFQTFRNYVRHFPENEVPKHFSSDRIH